MNRAVCPLLVVGFGPLLEGTPFLGRVLLSGSATSQAAKTRRDRSRGAAASGNSEVASGDFELLGTRTMAGEARSSPVCQVFFLVRCFSK